MSSGNTTKPSPIIFPAKAGSGDSDISQTLPVIGVEKVSSIVFSFISSFFSSAFGASTVSGTNSLSLSGLARKSSRFERITATLGPYIT